MDSISFVESVINGIIGSIFTAQRIPASLNLFITLNISDAGRVPGSIISLGFPLQVVFDKTIKQLSLYY
jgi:hypothetical protein